MKKIITLTVACLLGFSIVNAQTFSDDFESYTTGIALGPQSPDWRTWSGAGGGVEDVNVVTTDNHTVAGTKSIYFSSTLSTGGPDDVVLPFGTTELTTGQFSFTAWFKIPSTKTAYFNFQGNDTIGLLWALDCYMNADSTIDFLNSGTTVATGTFPVNTWFELTVNINLNANNWSALIDGVSIGSWQNSVNQLVSIDIFPANAQASFWVDDVSYNVVPYTLPAVNGATNLIGVSNGLVGQQRNISVKIRNLGTTVINSFDVSLDQNGGTPVVQNITGVTIASLGTTTVNITTPFTLLSGANTFTAIISNVNGAGPDGDAGDDTITATLTPVVPATGKMVVAEEGTGTWCQWCPRGAVYMDMMNTKYDGYFAGIAVHNGDPMVVTDYDTPFGPLISNAYPSVLVDRGPSIDPLAIEQNFFQRIQVAPTALIVNGANYNATTRQLDVSITATFQQTVSGDYRIACVLAEDSVTGTGSAYNQANAYAGGASGPMGGYESLPATVPASMMNYNHVARVISPQFDGLLNSYPSTVNANDVFTHNFTYFLPAAYDVTQLHIIGMMLDPSGLIDNASHTTIPEAITNGFVTGIFVTAVQEPAAPDAQLNIYPNPAAEKAILSLNLSKESTVQVAIYSVAGALLAKRDYGKLSGGRWLPVDMANYRAGMYFVHVTIDGKTSVLKLVKQ